MVQTFIGYKPGVGPVLKCLKYDTDDPLTLANNAYDRYYYNSENNNLSYVFTTNSFNFRAADISGLPTSFNIYNNLGRIVISGQYGEASSFYNCRIYYKISNAYPNIGYPPMTEFRWVDLNSGLVECGSYYNQIYTIGNARIVDVRQFYTVLALCTGYMSSGSTSEQSVYTGRVASTDSGNVGIGEWFVWDSQITYKDNRNPRAIYPNVWDLPANSSPMRSYSFVPGLEALRADNDEFILARPGFDVNTTNEFGTIISSRNRSPALCVMNGVINGLAGGASHTVYAPPGITLSPRAVVDVMLRVSGQVWSVPALTTDTTQAGKFSVQYAINGNSITFYNSPKDVLDIRYVVFNVDDYGTSTGGNQVMFTGNDGSRDFVQIKKPGTSDPASRPNDILFDSRLPQFQIIDQNFIPISAFYPANILTEVMYRVNFNNNGFIPYLKYSIVFENCVTTPFYRFQAGATSNPVSNISMLARVFDNYIDFHCSPNSGWSNKYSDGSSFISRDYGARIQGVRYYIFGIPQ